MGVNTTVVVAVARSVAETMDWTRLAQYSGQATLTVASLAKSLLNFSKRRATTKSNPKIINGEAQGFLTEVWGSMKSHQN